MNMGIGPHWEKSWLALVRESVHWLWTLFGSQGGLSDFRHAWSVWSEDAKQFPADGKHGSEGHRSRSAKGKVACDN